MKPFLPRAALLLLAIAWIVLLADQATKQLAMTSLRPGTTTPVIDGVLHWTLQRNPGAAFGILQRFPMVFTALAIALVIGVAVNLRRIPDVGHGVAVGLVLGGAMGNLADRLFRDPGPFRGHVVDFIDLRVWPVFNIADSAIVAGAGLLIVASWRLDQRTRHEQHAD